MRVLSNSGFHVVSARIFTGDASPDEALLRGSIPVLSNDELGLYGVELKDGENCVSVPDGGWRQAVERLARTREPEIARMRATIHAMFDDFLNYPAMAKRIRARVGMED